MVVEICRNMCYINAAIISLTENKAEKVQ